MTECHEGRRKGASNCRIKTKCSAHRLLGQRAAWDELGPSNEKCLGLEDEKNRRDLEGDAAKWGALHQTQGKKHAAHERGGALLPATDKP